MEMRDGEAIGRRILICCRAGVTADTLGGTCCCIGLADSASFACDDFVDAFLVSCTSLLHADDAGVGFGDSASVMAMTDRNYVSMLLCMRHVPNKRIAMWC